MTALIGRLNDIETFDEWPRETQVEVVDAHVTKNELHTEIRDKWLSASEPNTTGGFAKQEIVELYLLLREDDSE